LLLLALEVLRRVDAVNRAQRAERVNALLKCHATLGQYIIEMRHTINNALTSVLGNAELLLLEPGTFSAGVRSQIDTIRNMALRMHEILQRFSSLEKEMMFVEKQAAKEQRTQIQAAAVGQ
jgi:signal transduction histidine kinase